MQIPIQLLSRDVRAATIRQVADDLAKHAVPALRPLDLWKSRLTAPELLPLSTAQVRAGVDELTRLLPWVDDGSCYARGAIGASRLEAMLASAPRDAISGAVQAHAGVAVVSTSLSKTGWTYHAATVLRASGTNELLVVDRLLAPKTGLLTLDAWAAKIGRRATDVRIQQPLDNMPTGSGPITMPAMPHHLRGLGRELIRSLPRE